MMGSRTFCIMALQVFILRKAPESLAIYFFTEVGVEGYL